jgi:cystathionine beta-lyase
MSQKKNVTEILHHMGEEEFPFGAVSPPLFQTSIFAFPTFEDFRRALGDETHNCLYTRGNNPTVNLLESKIAALEHGERAKLVSSGAAAISASVLAFLKTGDHVVMVRDAYSWAKTLLEKYLARFGVEYTYVSGTDEAEIAAAIRPNTKIIYLESPTTFTFLLQDLKAVAALARKHGIKTVIDNTWATPIYQNPLDYGVDLVVHSGTKYFGGHSDLVAGVIVGNTADIEHIFATEFLNIGTVPDPFMAWLMLRGLRTLQVRMRTHYANALRVIDYLAQHPKVEEIYYPFYAKHPQYELAKAQMRGGSGLFSLKLATRDEARVAAFTNRLRFFKRAVSWGGYESLVFPYAVGHPDAPDQLIAVVRFHIGLEEPELLIESLETALKAI